MSSDFETHPAGTVAALKAEHKILRIYLRDILNLASTTIQDDPDSSPSRVALMTIESWARLALKGEDA